MSDKTNAAKYQELFQEHGPASVYDIMAVLDLMREDGKITTAEAHRLAQGLHGFCSVSVDKGTLERIGTKINADTGENVYVYQVPKTQIPGLPKIKVSKGYKERYEEARAQVEKLEQQLGSSAAFIKCVIRERDEARRQLQPA